jgi:hypothetical protein
MSANSILKKRKKKYVNQLQTMMGTFSRFSTTNSASQSKEEKKVGQVPLRDREVATWKPNIRLSPQRKHSDSWLTRRRGSFIIHFFAVDIKGHEARRNKKKVIKKNAEMGKPQKVINGT